ncbi:MAG: hypothetical protein AAFX93_19020 [Verrucomicrobiota bacterium]
MAIENSDIGKLLKVRSGSDNGTFEVEPLDLLAAVADVDDASLPADGGVAALTFSADPTQAECEALRDAVESMRDVIANQTVTIEALRDRLRETGGAGIIADS